MLTYPKSTMRVRRIPIHLSSGHVTLMPGKFYPALISSSRTHCAGRTHVGLCPKFLVYFLLYLSWPWCWLYTEVVYLSTDSHPSTVSSKPWLGVLDRELKSQLVDHKSDTLALHHQATICLSVDVTWEWPLFLLCHTHGGMARLSWPLCTLCLIKKVVHQVVSVTLSVFNGFSQFFSSNSADRTVVKDPTTLKMCRHTTSWNMNAVN